MVGIFPSSYLFKTRKLRTGVIYRLIKLLNRLWLMHEALLLMRAETFIFHVL